MLACQPFENVELSDIGEFVVQPALSQRNQSGEILPLRPVGYEHSFN